ncbi:tigger transposable element-derived protein 1-like [Palaemon carinicauda]|uniref:tigger transposable element-derived protein 1-like n=1 Tax=Palaemon carinicauda TaxID=392227 RepID=UPI0035B69C4B
MNVAEGKKKTTMLSMETKLETKASAIFGDIVRSQAEEGAGEGTSQQETPDFKASRGWFEKFKKRTGIHSVVRHGEAASSDTKAAEAFVKTFDELALQEGYSLQQVFNCDETGLFWKKMPRRTFITAELKRLPEHKPMKDRLTLAFCANAKKRLPMKCLLVLDNAPAHPPGLEGYLLAEYSFIKVLYLPPNTTPLLQPMDQQVISNFKKLYTKHLFQR